jgi:hypothetical protein
MKHTLLEWLLALWRAIIIIPIVCVFLIPVFMFMFLGYGKSEVKRLYHTLFG